jgi:DNA-binding MurR/RpiR family transcriptional regulator
MALLKPEAEFQQVVIDAFHGLPPQQQLVATFMLDHLREVPFLSVPELADRSGASEATIVRFAQRIGYTGFSSLKSALLQAVREKVASPTAPDDLTDRAPGGDVLEEVARLETENIGASVESLDRALMAEVADALFEARQVNTFGLGISSHFSELAAYLLSRIGIRVRTLPRGYSSPLEPLIALDQSDVVMVFSFPPYLQPTLDVARAARSRGATVVAVCDRATAPVAAHATFTIPVRSANMTFTTSFAAVSVMLNALTATIAVCHPAEAAAAASAITAILGGDDHVIGA